MLSTLCTCPAGCWWAVPPHAVCSVILSLAPSTLAQMAVQGALHLSEGPPIGVATEVYITDLLAYKLSLPTGSLSSPPSHAF